MASACRSVLVATSAAMQSFSVAVSSCMLASPSVDMSSFVTDVPCRAGIRGRFAITFGDRWPGAETY
jgi:hypothetical protein